MCLHALRALGHRAKICAYTRFARWATVPNMCLHALRALGHRAKICAYTRFAHWATVPNMLTRASSHYAHMPSRVGSRHELWLHTPLTYLTHLPHPVIFNRLVNLLACVHDKRTITRDRFVQRQPGNEQHFERALRIGRIIDPHLVAIFCE